MRIEYRTSEIKSYAWLEPVVSSFNLLCILLMEQLLFYFLLLLFKLV